MIAPGVISAPNWYLSSQRHDDDDHPGHHTLIKDSRRNPHFQAHKDAPLTACTSDFAGE
jgi:hypothetical protein